MMLISLAGPVGEAAAFHHHGEAAGAHPSLPACPRPSASRPHSPQPEHARDRLTPRPLLPSPQETPPGRSIHRELISLLSWHPCTGSDAGRCPGLSLWWGLGLTSWSSEITLEKESAIFSALLAILALSNAAFRPQNNVKVCYCVEPSAAPGKRREKLVFLQGN